jgi:hypothetical protein
LLRAEVASLIQSIAGLQTIVQQAFPPGTRILPHVNAPQTGGNTDSRNLDRRPPADNSMANNSRASLGEPGRDLNLGSSEALGGIGDTPQQHNTLSQENGRLYGPQTPNTTVQPHQLSDFSSMFDD